MVPRAQVAEVASWVLFLWLFALMAHDGLSNVPPLWWGSPLVLSLFYLVCFTVYEGYADFQELKKSLKEEQQRGLKAEEGEPENGDGLGEPESVADGAGASPPEDDASASTERTGADGEAGAQKEEEEDEEDPQAPEQSQLDFAIDMVLCNTSAEAAPTSVPPPSEAEGASSAGQNLFF